MGRNIIFENEVLKELKRQKDFGGIVLFVLEHASYLKEYHHYPEKIVDDIESQYRQVADSIIGRGLRDDPKMVVKFRKFSVIAICALEYCRPDFPEGQEWRLYYKEEFEKNLKSEKWSA